MAMPSQMHHNFSLVPQIQGERSTFDQSCSYKTTFDAGYIVPVYSNEVLPGDTFKLRGQFLARMTTPIVPIMDNLHFDTFWFFVPTRLVWDNWERFNGAQTDPDDSTDFLVPVLATGTHPVGSIADYLGMPTEVSLHDVCAFYHRAYNLVYNEWFRDENLIDSVPVHKGDGPDPLADYTLLKRCKRYDYFTSCLPWTQKGPAVTLPMTGNAPVYGDGKAYQIQLNLAGAPRAGNVVGSHAQNLGFAGATGTPGNPIGFATKASLGSTPSGLYADLSATTSATINDLRQAFAIQRVFERDARGGTRYVEFLRNHFGVISPDFRLQRPEYLGGHSGRVIITPVQQTSATDAETPQGNLAAYGLIHEPFNGFTHSFVEHGIILGVCCVWADLTYQQGLERRFSRRTRFDYYLPATAHLGEQAVLNREIYYHNDANDILPFGYQERWAEYRYKQSLITGKMRSTYATTLDRWHLAQKFDTLPTLGPDFIKENVPMDRVLAVPSEPDFLMDAYFNCQVTRRMPMYSVPGLIDHF